MLSQQININLINVRIKQLLLNSMLGSKIFKIPVHLALGHEAIAVSLTGLNLKYYQLVCTHRNVHHNLARETNFKNTILEYKLSKKSVSKGKFGCMNLPNENKNLLYSSSILGNNLAIGAGVGLANINQRKNKIIVISTGDGALEEGSFYETTLFLKSQKIPSVLLVENNEWSMSSLINERRTTIDLNKFASSFGINYYKLSSNNVQEYYKFFYKISHQLLKNSTPIIIECMVKTLGFWREVKDDFPKGKFINYHHGHSPSANFKKSGILLNNKDDPLYVLNRKIGKEKYNSIFNKQYKKFKSNAV